MAINVIGGNRNFNLLKQENPTGTKRRAGPTATTLFPENKVEEADESQVRY